MTEIDIAQEQITRVGWVTLCRAGGANCPVGESTKKQGKPAAAAVTEYVQASPSDPY